MRWQALFADLEAQLDEAERAELSAEVAERTRWELGRIPLAGRCDAARGAPLTLELAGGAVSGQLAEAGADWLLLHPHDRTELLVPLHAVLGVRGLPRAASTAGGTASAARPADRTAPDLRRVLRALVRDRSAVDVRVGDGTGRHGTFDRVGVDHVDLALHEPGEPRRAAAVRGVLTVPLRALVLVRRTA